MVDKNNIKPPFGPRHWLSWLLVAKLWLLGKLPLWMGRLLVRPLGPLTYHLMGRRRNIARRNIELCFPDLNEAQRRDILKGSFRRLAQMVIEMAWCWSGSFRRFDTITRLEGVEHLQDAEESGRGVLLLTFHTTCLEMGGYILSTATRVSGMYRPLNNPVIEWYQNRGRLRVCEKLIKKKDTRRAIRHLKNGGVLWYAPDQDFGPDQSEFAPFFGIQTATLMATLRFPALTGCAVVPMFPRYEKDTDTYVLTILPQLENFPSDDKVADLSHVNAIMEAHVRKVPEQYWWIHRRFKTRPAGEPGFYE